jgi:hypothetical protein
MSSETDVNKYIQDLFKLLNGGPDKSKVNDNMLRGLVRNFQEQYQFKREEEIEFVKSKLVQNDLDVIKSRGGSSLLGAVAPENEKLLVTAAKQKLTFDELEPAIRNDINLSADREFSKLVKRISYALSHNYIDANRFLIWAIALASTRTSKYDLLLISLILRYGKAERNMYLLVPEYGNVHLLVYTVLELEKKKGKTDSPLKANDTSIDNITINSILLLLTLSGSKSTSLAIYEEKVKFNEKGLPEYDSRVLTEASKRDKRVYEVTVAQWLLSKQYPNYIEPESTLGDYNIRNSIPLGSNEKLITYGLLLDKIEYAFPRGYELITDSSTFAGKTTYSKRVPPQPQLTQCTLYNAVEVGKKLNINHFIRSSESDVLRYCIDCLAEEIFEQSLKRGIKMTYFTVNRLCLAFKKATDPDRNRGKRVDSEIYLKMILDCAKYGVRIDEYQLNIVGNSDSSYIPTGSRPTEQIKKVYEQPLFKKACTSGEKAPLPKSLILIADSLGALKVENPEAATPKINKQETCDNLFKMFNDEPERIKEDAIVRIKERIRTTAYTLSEFTSGKINTIECENRPNNRDPLEYIDTALTYYRDEKDRLYCFPSFVYEDIVSSGFINPITGIAISVEARNKITEQLAMFKKLNINPNKIMPVEVAAITLKDVEHINNDHTKFSEDTIINMFRSRGVPDNILKTLSADQYNKILKIVSMCQGYLPELETKHRFATFCKALYSYLKKNLEQVPLVLNAITVQQADPLSGPKPITQ